MKTFDLNIFQLLIILGSIQGLVFAGIIFLRKKFRVKSNIFLGLHIIFIALSNLQHILIDMEFLSESSVIRKLYLPVQWLILPMLYLHVHEVFFKKKVKFSKLLFLFTPVVFVFVLHIVYFIFNYGSVPISAMPDYYAPGLLLYINFISFFYNGVVVFLIYRKLKNSPIPSKKETKKKYDERNWYLKILALIVLIVGLGISVSISLIQFDIDHTWSIYTLFLLISFVGYYMGYVGVYRSTLGGDGRGPINSASKNGASTYQKVHSYIVQEKLYLNIDLNQSEIAEEFNISPGYLSQVINANSDQSFNDYINSLRIDASKKMLIESEFENYTIESIGLECGFKSKSNFYSAFKKFTGQTPSGYVKFQKMRPVS